jgi:adenine/guanine phosphoribosyltransferase-like PRPP-binding protein
MSYLLLNHERRTEAINKSVSVLKSSGLSFDSIVCCGLSGSLVGPEVARKLKKNLILVRKKEPSHGSTIEYDWEVKVKKYVILDDLVESGKTVKYLQKVMKQFPESSCQGVFFYKQRDDTPYSRKFVKNNPKLWIEFANPPEEANPFIFST